MLERSELAGLTPFYTRKYQYKQVRMCLYIEHLRLDGDLVFKGATWPIVATDIANRETETWETVRSLICYGLVT